jgi:alpha-L-rhamnosidase
VDFLHAHAEGYIIHKGIGDHESLDPKQTEVTGTAFLYYNTRTVSKLAKLLGRREEAERYAQLAEAVKKAFVEKFYDPRTGAVGIGTEANQAFALYFHLLSAEEEEKAFKMLLEQIREKKEHVSTGIFGTKYLLEVLSEHWDYSDNIYSQNHPMFGSISGWFYKYLAGIRPALDAVGYNKVILEPSGFERLRFVRADYGTPQGLISVSWERKADSLYYDVTVPVNTSATVVLPGREERVGAGHYTYGVRMPAGAGQGRKQ